MGAITIGSLGLNSLFWLFSFLRMGTTGLTATAYGEGSKVTIMRVLNRSLIIGLAVSVLLLAAQKPLLGVMMLITGPDPEIRNLAETYFNICIWTAPAQLLTMAITGWFIGMQTTVKPMIVAIATNVVNIAASLILVFVAGMGYKGIAYGTLTAQYIGLSVAVILALIFWRKKRHEFEERPEDKKERFGWRRLFGVNINLFFRSAFMIAVSMTMTSIGARIGQTELAANAIGVQFWLFYSYFMDGYAFAGEALVGRFTGEGNIKERRIVVTRLLMWAGATGIFFSLIYGVFYHQIVGLMTDVESVRSYSGVLLPWIVALPLLTVAAFTFDGIYVGLTRTNEMMISTLLGCITFFTLTFLIHGGELPGNEMLWTAFESYLLIRGIYLTARYYLHYQRMR